MTKKNKGFTLAELLIVVAIIAVLVAISIPIFSTQLEKAREATDLANVRSAYAKVMAAAINEDKSEYWNESTQSYEITVDPLKQTQKGWVTDTSELTIGGVNHDDSSHWIGDPEDGGGSCEVTYNIGNGVVFIWSGESTSNTMSATISIPSLNELFTRSGWRWDQSTVDGITAMGIRGSDSDTSTRVSLTGTPVALNKGSTITITSQDGYETGYFLMKYTPGVGFVQVFNSGWKKGTVNINVDQDGLYLVTNTKKSDGTAISKEEAILNTTISISNKKEYSTDNLKANSLASLNATNLARTQMQQQEGNSQKPGGTLYEAASNAVGCSTVNVSAGSILSITGNTDYSYAYYYTTSDGRVLYDSGWFAKGVDTAFEVPEDCQVRINVKGTGTMTDERLASALENVTIYN